MACYFNRNKGIYFPHFEINEGHRGDHPSNWRRKAVSRDRHSSDKLNGESRRSGRGISDFVQSRASLIQRSLGRHGVVGIWPGR